MTKPEPTSKPASSSGSILGAILALVRVLGTVVYAIVAQVVEPPLEPARTFMIWQAQWNRGHYGVKYNFAVTWISTLFALFGPVLLAGASIRAIQDRSAQPVMPTDWRELAWKHMDRAARLRLGLGLTGIALLFGGVCLFDASLLSPVGFLAQILLIVWPFTAIAGPVLLVDELVPERIVIGPIEALEHIPHARPHDAFQVKLAGKQFAVPEALWRQLTASDTIAVRPSSILDNARVVAVRRAAG